MVKKTLASVAIGKEKAKLGVWNKGKEAEKQTSSTKKILEKGMRWLLGGAYRINPEASKLKTIDVAARFGINGEEFVVLEDKKTRKWTENMVRVSYAMLETGFKLPLDEDLAKLLVYFDSSPCQMSVTFWLVVARAKALEKAYGRRFGFSEVARCFTVKNLPSHEVSISCLPWSFIEPPSSFKHVNDYTYVFAGEWNRTGLPVRNQPRCDNYRPNKLPKNKTAEANLKFYFQTDLDQKTRNLRCEDEVVSQIFRNSRKHIRENTKKVVSRRKEDEEEVPIRVDFEVKEKPKKNKGVTIETMKASKKILNPQPLIISSSSEEADETNKGRQEAAVTLPNKRQKTLMVASSNEKQKEKETEEKETEEEEEEWEYDQGWQIQGSGQVYEADNTTGEATDVEEEDSSPCLEAAEWTGHCRGEGNRGSGHGLDADHDILPNREKEPEDDGQKMEATVVAAREKISEGTTLGKDGQGDETAVTTSQTDVEVEQPSNNNTPLPEITHSEPACREGEINNQEKEIALIDERSKQSVEDKERGNESGHMAEDPQGKPINPTGPVSMPRREQVGNPTSKLTIERGSPREPVVIEFPDLPEVEHVRREDTQPHSSSPGNASTTNPGMLSALLRAIESEMPALLQRIQKAAQEQYGISGVTREEMDDLRLNASKLEESKKRLEDENAQLRKDLEKNHQEEKENAMKALEVEHQKLQREMHAANATIETMKAALDQARRECAHAEQTKREEIYKERYLTREANTALQKQKEVTMNSLMRWESLLG